MATTLTLWIGVWPKAYLVQVGDSRFYVLRGTELIQISRDQTIAQEFVDQGIFTPADAATSRLKHHLSSSIGGPQSASVVTSMSQDWDNVGLLCSGRTYEARLRRKDSRDPDQHELSPAGGRTVAAGSA
ncbi:MAG: PP2C family protein-serine/threonine phosphatase [Gemmatimonadales bacterium]